MNCLACRREGEDTIERKGHDCGRLDRLGGDLVALRSLDDTTQTLDVLSRYRHCRICRGVVLDANGTCVDPGCWLQLRDASFPHRRPTYYPPDLRTDEERAIDHAEEDHGLYLAELREGRTR